VHDSSAKLPSGVFQGNIQQLGDFDQCLGESSSPDGNVNGRYCLTNVQVSLPDEFKFLRYLKEKRVLVENFRSTLRNVRLVNEL
jgi:hypothetical protein